MKQKVKALPLSLRTPNLALKSSWVFGQRDLKWPLVLMQCTLTSPSPVTHFIQLCSPISCFWQEAVTKSNLLHSSQWLTQEPPSSPSSWGKLNSLCPSSPSETGFLETFQLFLLRTRYLYETDWQTQQFLLLILGWPKSSFGFFHNISWKNIHEMLWKNPNRFFANLIFLLQAVDSDKRRITVAFWVLIC